MPLALTTVPRVASRVLASRVLASTESLLVVVEWYASLIRASCRPIMELDWEGNSGQ